MVSASWQHIRSAFQISAGDGEVAPSVINPYEQRWPMMAFVTVIIGVSLGFAGMGLGLLLRLVQHIAYGYSLHKINGGESFLHGVTASSDLRRFLVLCICGAVAGFGWWLLYRFGRPLVSIKQATRENGPRLARNQCGFSAFDAGGAWRCSICFCCVACFCSTCCVC